MHTDRCGNTRSQKFCAKGSGKGVKIQEFMCRDTANVEPEMYDCTSNNWSHWNSNEKFKEKFGNCTRKTFDRFTTKDSYTWNITNRVSQDECARLWESFPYVKVYRYNPKHLYPKLNGYGDNGQRK